MTLLRYVSHNCTITSENTFLENLLENKKTAMLLCSVLLYLSVQATKTFRQIVSASDETYTDLLHSAKYDPSWTPWMLFHRRSTSLHFKKSFRSLATVINARSMGWNTSFMRWLRHERHMPEKSIFRWTSVKRGPETPTHPGLTACNV